MPSRCSELLAVVLQLRGVAKLDEERLNSLLSQALDEAHALRRLLLLPLRAVRIDPTIDAPDSSLFIVALVLSTERSKAAVLA